MNNADHIEGGAFLVSRQIFDNTVWTDIHKFRLWFYLLGNARHSKKVRKVGDISVGYGQFLRSYRKIAEDCQWVENRQLKKWSTSQIKRMIDDLMSENRVKITGTELGTLFTICNFHIYQDLTNYRAGNLERNLEQYQNNTNNVNNVYNKLVTAARSLITGSYTDKELYPIINKFKKLFGEDQLQKIIGGCIARGNEFSTPGKLAAYLQAIKNNGSSNGVPKVDELEYFT